ncbi:plant UBX domain-containing protein 1-like [Telopea speciosissima]|uniref:plant UBX domain-containing protein 1-like n=1 Tax=Telopea speciosissima TaxID=54955 RepID=UPI001CC6AD28|nr:plant UBX domain-containing protein 1-like [Telopea speciosissima]XP_043704496.1 plant UBX domain-containing protein 1-like [Telopea speciosissima]
MRVDGLIDCSLKRRRLMSFDPMDDADIAKTKFAAMAEELGREIRVFETSPTSLDGSVTMTSSEDEPDDFYEFTAEDYFRLLATKKEDKFLKTRKIREAEETARRSRITKAIIRVRFPDNCTLEVKFHSSEALQSLIDLLLKVVARPDLPFYIYTTPPKKRIVDLSQDFYSAGLIPGAIVYFSYDVQKGDNAPETSVPFLRDEIMCLKGLDVLLQQAEPVQSAVEPVMAEPSPVVQERKAVEKKPVKPKWLKM